MTRGAHTLAQSPDHTAIDLTRLLSRLEQIVLTPQADPHLKSDHFDRARVGANVEYARALLLRVEHDSAGIKQHSRKQAVQAELQQKRELIRRLNQRLQELDELEESDASVLEDDDDDDDASSLRDIIPNYGPARTASDSIDTEKDDHSNMANAAAHLASTLRSRRGQPSASEQSTSTGSALSPSGTKPDAFEPTASDDSTAQTEKIMSHNRVEQEALTESLLTMAQALKASSLKFQSSLESEKDVLGRASEGLDKSATSMEAAGRRMGMLRRLTEGKGWLARISMYVWIAALYVVLFIVFALPKIRW